MSKIPNIKKTKYNQNNPFRWVDSQWEKFMTEQKELKRVVTQLQEDLITCNKYFQKQRNQLLELEMENAELKDQVLDLGGEYKEERTDEWKIEQFNRNRTIEDQVKSIKEMKKEVRKIFGDKNMRIEHKQITDLHIENSSLKRRIEDLEKDNMQLREDFRRLHRLYTFGTPTDGLEVGSPEDYEVDNQLNLFDNK